MYIRFCGFKSEKQINTTCSSQNMILDHKTTFCITAAFIYINSVQLITTTTDIRNLIVITVSRTII